MPGTMPDFARCTIRHPDGRWLYHLPTADAHGVTAVLAEHTILDGPGTELRPMAQIGKSRWWATNAEATRLVLVKQPAPLVTGYALDDPDTASVRYPATLTVQEWQARRTSQSEIDRLWDLYHSVTEPQAPIEEPIDGPFVILDGGEPPAADARQWHINLVDSITQRPEYAHLFPGYLTGLRAHVRQLIDRMPRVKHCFDGYQGAPGLHVVISVPFEQPITRWQPDISRATGKTLKSGRTVPVTVDRRLTLPVPDQVAAGNYDAALTEWDRQVTYWTSQVTEASVAACNHCHGTGHVPAGAEKYEASR
jgi:hypothetical protein